MNNTQTRDFVELTDPRDVEVYKAFGKEQAARIEKGKKERPFKNFKEKLKTANGKSGLKKITSKYNNWQDRVWKSEEERQSALAKICGVGIERNFRTKKNGLE